MLKLKAHELFDVETVLTSLVKALRALRRGKPVQTDQMYEIGETEQPSCLNPDLYLISETLSHSGKTPEYACLHLAFLYGIEQGRRLVNEGVIRYKNP
jgi:hypothetical protein